MQQAILYTSIQGIFRDYGDFAGNHSDTLDEWDYVTQDADFWAKYVLVLEDGKPVFVCHAILGDDCDRTISTILISASAAVTFKSLVGGLNPSIPSRFATPRYISTDVRYGA